MEVTRRLITIGLLGAMLSTFTAADIIVQPGYGQQYQGIQQVPNKLGRLQSPLAGSAAAQEPALTLEEEFERYRNLHRNIEGQLVHLIHEQNAQNLGQMPPGVVGYPLFPRVIHPLLPHIGGGRLFSLTPAGAHGLHLGGYGIRRRPVLLRESADPYSQQGYSAARSQWPRSVTGGPGLDDGVDGKVHDVATEPTVEAGGVVDLQVPDIRAVDESMADKLVEPRQIGRQDDAIVGSPLDKIHYESPHNNNDQHHPSGSSGISSNVIKAVKAVGSMIDAVAPGAMNYENKDPASAMTRHQDPNYRHDSQYPQSSQQGQRNESPSLWNAGYNSQPMTGQSYNSEQRTQNSGWNSIAQLAENVQSPKASGGNRFSHQQAPATYPASNSAINPKNWLTTTHGHHPSNPSYPSDRQHHYERPPTGSYPPHSSYPGPSSSYPGGASSSATANAGTYHPGFGPGTGGSVYPSGATSSATANASNGSGFRPSTSPYNHGSPAYPSGASSSATANASNQPGYGSGPYSGPGYSYPSGATSSATANVNNHPGYGNGPYGPSSPYNHGSAPTNSATASATANSGPWFTHGISHPYRSAYNNAYAAYSPYAKYVDQFGRALSHVFPSSMNSGNANAGYYNTYLKNFVQNQVAGLYKQPGYSYY